MRGHTQNSEQEKEQRYRATYYTYLAIGHRISYTPSDEAQLVEQHTKCCLSVLVLF